MRRERLRRWWLDIPRRERLALLAAMALGLIVVLAYVLAHRHAGLVGDEPEYDTQGRFFLAGKWWWSTTPFGVAHASAWKTPGYPAWVGFWYWVLGPHPARVEAVQALMAPLTVLLAWLLARRLFDARVALATAFIVALFPLIWQYTALLYPEALAVPLTLGVLLVFMGRAPTSKRAVAAGALIGVAILVRPNSFVLLAVAAAAWIVAAGWRRGIVLAALATAVAALVVAPWTIRNTLTDGIGFVPLSVQDGAIYGTFNSEAANDPENPWAWRPILQNPPAVLARGVPVSDSELRSDLVSFGLDYIRAHPASVPQAFFWNGLSRFWDVRRPGHALDEVAFVGGTRAVTAVGLGIYYVLFPLALVALWRLRRRRELIAPLLVLALASSVVFTIGSETRYRAPLEPLIAMLAAAAVVGWADARRPTRAA